MSDCKVLNLGTIDYLTAYNVQKNCVEDVIQNGTQALIFCQHPLVLTMGRLAADTHLFVSKEDLEKQNIQVYDIDRGGEVTLHSVGQMVIYPILDLKRHKKDLHYYLHQLEEVVIDLLNEFAIVARREQGKTGVWVNDRKLASIGIGVKKWVSYHGLGINVNTNLDDFKLIRPCGLNVQMTSMHEIKKTFIDMNEVENKFMYCFNRVFKTDFKKEL